MPSRPWPPPSAAAAICLLGLVACSDIASAQWGKPPPLGAAEALPGVAGKPPWPPAGRPSSAAGKPAPGGQVAGALAGKPPPLPPGGGPFGGGGPGGARRPASSGTGFVVAPGRVMTNHHVAEGCAEMRLRAPGGAEFTATVAATDAQRDLALLTVVPGGAGDLGPPLRFRNGPPVRRGEGVVTYGFPLAGLLSSGPTLTTGEVSALAGLRDNQRHFQISAPVQPGNSGGPLFDLAGNVVGVVTSKLNAQRVAQSTGDIPQNVNFAVKGEEAVDFLRRNGVQPRLATSDAAPRGAAEVGEVAHPSTVFLRCMR